MRALLGLVIGLATTAALMGEDAMPNLPETRHISIGIDRPPRAVYDFASKPENLPKWATGLGKSIQQVDGEWVADSPMGKVKVQMSEKNNLGVLDHDVILPSGVRVHNPIRVVPRGAGSEVTFTLIRQPGTSDEQFARDAAWVQKDLGILKELLEGKK